MIRDVTGQVTRVDRVAIATHADQALGLLADPSDAEVTTLKQFGDPNNQAVCTPIGRGLAAGPERPRLLELPDDVLRGPASPPW